jgi:ribosomal protein L12E/L44/L45/RPP1/RPP2
MTEAATTLARTRRGNKPFYIPSMEIDSVNKTILLTALLIALPLTGCEQATQHASDLAKQSAQEAIDGAKKSAEEALGLGGEGSKDEAGKEGAGKEEEGKEEEGKEEEGKEEKD